MRITTNFKEFYRALFVSCATNRNFFPRLNQDASLKLIGIFFLGLHRHQQGPGSGRVPAGPERGGGAVHVAHHGRGADEGRAKKAHNREQEATGQEGGTYTTVQ